MNALNARSSGQFDTAKQSAGRMRALAIGVALVTNVLILIVGRIVNGEFPVATVGNDDQTVGFVPVIVVTLLVGLVAWGLLALLERMTSRATAIWTAIAVIVFLLSLLGPLGSGVNASSKVVLACMHVGAAAAIIPLMRRSSVMQG
jgi:hypothetical protein